MNYYPFHIGDFRSGTLHLNDAEELAYRRAIDWYYDTELPIPLETQWVARRLRVDEKVLETVLKDFFVKTDEGWRNSRCDAEIASFVKLCEKNRANGAKGGRPPKKKSTEKKPEETQAKPNGNPLGSASDANGNPVESDSKGNQDPLPNTQHPLPIPPLPPEGEVGAGLERGLPAEPHELGLPGGVGVGGHRMASAVCLMAKGHGMQSVNASHPKLQALLQAGVPMSAFEGAVMTAVKGQKNFGYMLAIVEREEKDARQLATDLSSQPRRPAMNRQEQLEDANFAAAAAFAAGG